MDKEKQIEEIAKNMCGNSLKEMCAYCKLWDSCYSEAKNLYAAGYRKQSDAISEFVLQLIERFKNTETTANCLHGRSNTEINQIIKIVAAEFGVEVE